jgi:hypothetical protein
MKKVLSTSNQIENFLKGIVSESIKGAEEALSQLDENHYASVIEQDEKDVEEDSKEGEEQEEKNPMLRAPRKAPKRPETGSEVKLSNILYDINQIRSGRSLKDPDVKGNLSDYFDKLDNAERMALSEFLEGLTDVIVKGIPAEDAEDPSEEIEMKDLTAKKPDEEKPEEGAEDKEEPEEGSEDLTPPIRVTK